MKIFTLLYLSLFITAISNSYACQISISESYVQTFLNPPVSGAYPKCESEPCHCVDKINAWHAELVDNAVLDYIAKSNETACVDELDCDAKFIELSCSLDEEKIKNYDSLSVYCAKPVYKIEGKKLVENPDKKAAYEASQLADKASKEKKEKDKKAAIQKFLATDISKANSIVKLQAILIDLQKSQE